MKERSTKAGKQTGQVTNHYGRTPQGLLPDFVANPVGKPFASLPSHREKRSVASFNIFTNCLRRAVLSCQVRALTRLPSTTQLCSTYLPPNCVTSRAHLATVVNVRPWSTPAAAAISTP